MPSKFWNDDSLELRFPLALRLLFGLLYLPRAVKLWCQRRRKIS